MKIYGHDKGKMMAAAREKGRVGLAYPSGKNHVMLESGQHINPHKDRRSKKQRVRDRRARGMRPGTVLFSPPPMMTAPEPAPPAPPEQNA